MRSIPMDVLRAFVAVVEARGFTRAAEALGRSQPTVSLQVKRLEELMEAPLFEKAARFELTSVGAVAFDYGKRLLRLHDDMLDEAERRNSPGAVLRVGLPSAFASPLAHDVRRLGEGGQAAGFEIQVDASARLVAAFRQNALDIAVVVADDESAVARWRAPLAWYGAKAQRRDEALPLALPLPESSVHQAAIGALRTQGRKFDIVCTSADFAARTAAASAGLGVAPMIEGLAPPGLRRSTEKGLPALAPVTVSLLAHSTALASAGRRWVEEGVPTLVSV